MPKLITLGSWYFDLDCGRHVEVRGMYCQQTYLSLLEGGPSRSFDEWVIEEVKTEMKPLWGNRKTHVILPPNFGERSMPFMRFSVWLSCNKPIDPQNVGSELVVVWFQNQFCEISMDKLVGDAIQSLAWDELAQDHEGN